MVKRGPLTSFPAQPDFEKTSTPGAFLCPVCTGQIDLITVDGTRQYPVTSQLPVSYYPVILTLQILAQTWTWTSEPHVNRGTLKVCQRPQRNADQRERFSTSLSESPGEKRCFAPPFPLLLL